jgi:serine/threonine-protein kinase 24/25/MST4
MKGEKPSHPKYYEETLQDLSPRLEQDEWVFDTVKPTTVAHPKRRKMSRIPSDASDVTNPYATIEAREGPATMLERMDITEGPLGSGSPANGYPTMMRKPSHTGTSRRSSTATAVRVPSGQTPTARRVSRTDGTPQKKPLGLDMSFGNSPSSARPFRRVSSGGHEKKRLHEREASNSSIVEPRSHGLDRKKSASNASTLVGSDENTPPLSLFEDKLKELPIPVKPIQVTKESLLGRRAYSKVIDSTFQEQHAQTGDLEKREALARLHNAWSVLDRVDPEGEFLLLRSLIENAKEDPKLAAALGLSSTLPPSTPISSPVKQTSTKPSATNPQASPTKNTSMAPPPPSTPRPKHRHSQSVSNIDTGTPNQRLVLAQNNPHLKSHHRRRQSTIVDTDVLRMQQGADEKRLPGYVPQGMEQSGGLADALYTRWLDGLRGRWGMA